jgi:hypothetical protein
VQRACAVTAEHHAAPDVVALSGRVTVTLTLQADCSSVHVPAHVALVFDNSPAMGGVRMNYMRQAVAAFVDALDFDVARVGLGSYHSFAEVLAPLTADPAAVIAATDRFYPRPGSNLTMGVRAGRQMLEAGRGLAAVPDPEEVLILMVGDQNDNGPEEALAEAQAAKDAGITIVTIGAGVNADPELLEAMASSAALFRSEGTGSRWPSLFESLAADLGTVNAVGAAITNTLPSAFDYVFGTGFPVPRVRGKELSWQFGVFPPDGVRVQYQLEPMATGRRPVSSGARADLVMDRGLPQSVTFPIPEVDVVDAPSPTPEAATPTVTPSPTPRLFRAFLPLASRAECLAAPAPLELTLVVDTSGSMMTALPGGGVRLDAVVSAGDWLLDGLRFPVDTGAVVAAGSSAVVLSGPTSSRGGLASALGRTYGYIGDTYDLDKGLALAGAIPPDPDRTRVVVAVTDGVASPAAAAFEVESLRRAGAVVEVVGFGPGARASDIAQVAGAGAHWSAEASGLPGAMAAARRAARCDL